MFIMVLDIDISNIYPSLVFFCSIPGYKLQAHDIVQLFVACGLP